MADPVAGFRSLLEPSEVITPDSPEYQSQSLTWSADKHLHPKVVLRPKSLDSLSKAVKHLRTTDLDFNVRSRGFGSASAKDVLISMTAFDHFDWDPVTETVTLGAGANWGSFYRRMEEVAPKHMIVASRTPSLGVGGSTLCSGFSWLSHEYGCASDAANMLDVQVVLADGTVAWASQHPDLLWAMRGSGGGFAIATAFKFAAKPFPENGSIWGGAIFIPRHQVNQAARSIARMCARTDISPKVAMFLYVMRKEILQSLGADSDMLIVHAYDALGEEHGRQEFAWALNIEGAIDSTKGNMTMRETADLQAQLGDLQGTSEMYWTPMAISTLTEQHILNSFAWWEHLQTFDSAAQYGYLLFELFSCRDNLVSRSSSAWPRPLGFKHMLLIGAGCAPGADPADNALAKHLVKDVAPPQILGDKDVSSMMPIPNALEDFHDMKVVYGAHYERLKEIKRKYDPDNRLKGWIRL